MARSSRSSAGTDTPLMKQWREVKSKNRDSLVFFRVGDFYELFFEDAEEGARLLELTLTSRNNGAAGRVPLAGVPVKSIDEYLARLVKLGKRVAICEQVEDPAEAKGIVRREVVETVTPGTVLSDSLLDAKRNNFIVALAPGKNAWGFAALDITTGDLFLLEVSVDQIADELLRFEPRELLLPDSADLAKWGVADPVEQAMASGIRTFRPDWFFDAEVARDELVRRYRVQSLDGFGFEERDVLLVQAAGALVAYVEEIRLGATAHLRAPKIQRKGAVMTLDAMTRHNLELVEPLWYGHGQEGVTLLSVLDMTVTSMGGRLFRSWILNPLLNVDEIRSRQDGVSELYGSPKTRAALIKALKSVSDLDRLATRIASGRATPREVLALGRSSEQLPAVVKAAAGLTSQLARSLTDDIDSLDDLATLVSTAIAKDAPATLGDGGVIKDGFNTELDDLRATRDGARDFIIGLQARERKRTSINSLKVGYNRVFGYYLEVTKTNQRLVPDHYIRKQTLVASERYFTAELKEWEEKVLDAEERIGQIEQEVFSEVRSEIARAISRIRDTSQRVATLDVLVAMAEVAERRSYVCPEVGSGFSLDIQAGRHPVVETVIGVDDFIPNDLHLDRDGRIIILTGPNMAGKSTVLRQVGLIQLMAQIGSFVPATRARLGLCDRIFTRVGASDRLTGGQSTFMVEMNETAAIIHGASERSLILLDEIGRGTSTYDGVSIAWAVTEYLHEHIGAKAIFATHYHELTQMGDLLGGVKNMNVGVRESGERIIFLRCLEEGGADRSYGIHVARLAGFPQAVTDRAMELLVELEGTRAGDGGNGLGREGELTPAGVLKREQFSLFGPKGMVARAQLPQSTPPTEEHPALLRLRKLNPNSMTPLDALTMLHTLHRVAISGDVGVDDGTVP